MFQRIDAIAVHVRDWDHCLRWYSERLDLVPYHLEEEHQFAVLGLAGGGAVLHLVGDPGAATDSTNRCTPMIAVEDFDAALARLHGAGVQVLTVMDDNDDGYRLARIADPEGNAIGIYTM